uniref:Uncharacterized protein LOC111127132 n=1 Tax=Crassostrea virginica TaxID=6565 RepID=A0A8B8DJI7_CRAVI|nr:uncharacterized protein LOC111127132 [Crassostrea virginica]
MAVTDHKKVWMGGHSRELKLFDLQGHLHRTVTITCTVIYICLHNKQVVFSDNLKTAVKRVSDDDTVLTVFETKAWNPFGITSTASGDLLVCLRKDDQSKVVRYSSTGTVLQEIQYDSKCQPLYQWAWNIAENIHGDVILTDFKRNAAIAVNQNFRGDKIHMLDQNGKFLRYIIPHGERIDHPRAICMLDDDELIVGEYLSGFEPVWNHGYRISVKTFIPKWSDTAVLALFSRKSSTTRSVNLCISELGELRMSTEMLV